jgi:hypothetical protein
MITKMIAWIDGHFPVFCYVCRHIIFEKDAIYKHNTVARTAVPLCKKCYKEIFQPYARKEEQ